MEKTKDTISEIQNYLLRHQKTENDPIEDKSKYRVTRAIAENIKQVNPLSKGKCNLCSKEDDQLFPVDIKVCPTCANRFIKKGGELEVLRKETIEYYCDYCLVRTFTVFYINPKVCIFCSKRLGRTHKFGTRDMQRQKRIDQKRKQKIIGGD
jgi:hypothetical protein